MVEEKWRGVQAKGWITLSSGCWEEKWHEETNQWREYVKHKDEALNEEILKRARGWGLMREGVVRR